ncbi:MAG TPA: tetratricopeptide repeat protein [Xanthomonadales bacterium]|nr:tetratricopeptide repeat protein [Xanthomonadales bacterium]
MNRPPDRLAAAFDALKQGRLPEAEKLARALAKERPTDARPSSLLARILAARGDVEGARVAVDTALAIDARSVPALVESAALARRANDLERAATDLGRLVDLQPLYAGFHHDLGVVELDRGNRETARQALETARGLAPNQPETRFKLGNLEFQQERWQQAVTEYQGALALKPDFAEAWLNLGETLLKLDRGAEALAAFRRAAAIDAKSYKAREGESRALWAVKANMRDWLVAREAMAAIQDDAKAWTQLGTDYGLAGHFVESRAAIERALAKDPDYLPARWNLMQTPRDLVYADEAAQQRFLAEWREGLAHFESHEYVVERVPEYVQCVGQATNFYVHYLGQAFLDEQRRYARVIERMVAAVEQFAGPGPAYESRPRDGRTRVGIVSGFLRRHTVTKLFGGLVLGLDKSRFELSLFHTAETNDEGTKPLREHADFFALGERPIVEWAHMIRSRELDVLVFLDIGMHAMMQALASLRLAPREYMLWGHPVTSGFRAIDAFLSSDAMERDDAQADYHERLVRLPRLGCFYEKPVLEPVPVAELAGGEGRIDVFFAQSAFKIVPAFDDVLARIAQRAPAVRFHLTPHPQPPVRNLLRSRMQKAFAARGLDFGAHSGLFRFVTEAEFMGLAKGAHFSLDSIGWSGGNTTLEILWHDTPVLTLPGHLMRSRHTMAILRQLDLDELVAKDVDDYVEKAVRLATDADWRESLRERVRERKHVLYEDRGVVDAFARLLAGDD